MASESLGVKELVFPFGTFIVEQFDGRSLWPAGDPVSKDNETLVVFLSRQGDDDYDPTV